MTATRLIVIRHAESDWNASGRRQGQADPPLSELGREQAAAAAISIGEVAGIVSSDLQRAAQTAAIIGRRIGVGPVVLDQRLRERDAGEWTGLTRAEIDERWPGWREGKQRPEGYEPAAHVVARVLEALSATHTSNPGSVHLVVTHRGVIRRLEKSQGISGPGVPHLGGVIVNVSTSGIEVRDRLSL
jgi:probable phosphoglycerate mutase